jgi:hypothetical protein
MYLEHALGIWNTDRIAIFIPIIRIKIFTSFIAAGCNKICLVFLTIKAYTLSST